MPKQEGMKRLPWWSLLPLLAVAACTQPGVLSSDKLSSDKDRPAENRSIAASGDKSIASASPDKWQPPPDPVFDEFLPNTERSSILPGKVGECADTTITSITDRYGADLTPANSRKGADKGTIVRFSNSGVQVSLDKERAVARSQIFDKVNMCLVAIPRDCPAGDIRGRVYKTTNLRTGESWSLANDVRNCGA